MKKGIQVSKRFKIPREEIKDVAKGLGRCLSTDMITVEGKKLGYMYREKPRDENDSGWVFLCGKESQLYMGDPHNIEIYDVNTIANYCPDIVYFLDSPYGSAFERNTDGFFEKIDE